MAEQTRGFRTFLVIWFGELISALGSGLTGFGLGVWVYETTGEVNKFALIALVTTVPGILLSPLFGVIADRFDRRILLVVANFGSGVAIWILFLLQSGGRMQLWHIYVLMGISSAFGSLLWPAMTALVSQLVHKEQLGRASGLNSMAEAASMILGPILGAVLLTSAGLRGIFIFDAISFAIAIACSLSVRTAPPQKTTPLAKEGGSFISELTFGFPYVFARPGLLGLMGFFMMVNFAGSYVNTLFVPLVLMRYSRTTLGIILLVGGLSMLLGGILMGAWGGPKRKVSGILFVGVLISTTTILFALPPNLFVYSCALAIGMFGLPIVNGCSQAIWQRKIAHDIQGKVFAVRRIFAFAMTPLALLTVGPLADKVFEPGMKQKSLIQGVFGSYFGHESGAGIRVMMFLFGVVMFVLTFTILRHPRVQNVEAELPDAVPDEG